MGLPFFPASAKTGHNVGAVFIELIREMRLVDEQKSDKKQRGRCCLL